MLKKITIASLLVILSGALIWGGVNRTLAKSGDEIQNEGRYSGQEMDENERGGGYGRANQTGETDAYNEGAYSEGAFGEGWQKADGEETGQSFGRGRNVSPVESGESHETESEGYRGGKNADVNAEGGQAGGIGSGFGIVP